MLVHPSGLELSIQEAYPIYFMSCRNSINDSVNADDMQNPLSQVEFDAFFKWITARLKAAD
jgi:hypothetical protein